MAARRFSVTIPAETRALRALRAFVAAVLDDGGCPEAERIVLAIDEACSNVIKYRCPTIDDGAIDVHLDLSPAALRVRIGRFCRTAEIDRIKPRALDDVRPGGLGTSFIAQIMDRVEFAADPEVPDCVALVLEKNLTAPRTR